jgi:hypothetical protein
MVSHNNVPSVALTPQKLAFGNVIEYTTANVTMQNVPSIVTLMNPSTFPLHVTSVAAGGDFLATSNCVGTIPAGGGVCPITVTFTPTVIAPETQLLSIYDNATGSPHVVSLTGAGVTGTGSMAFTPTSLVFPAETMNVTSPAQTVIMTNNGQTPLTVTNITTTGDFAETTTCPFTPFTIAVNESCAFQITFTPTSTGVLKGSLVVTDNTTSGSSTLSLTGTGNANFNLASSTLTQSLAIGTTTTTFTISLSSVVSEFTDTIALKCESGSCSFNPGNIALNSTTIPSSSILTLSGLSALSTNPYIFTVDGQDTLTNAIATLTLTIYFQDFSISASPAIETIVSGATTIYTVTVSPINGFSQPVALSCLSSSLPKGALCIASPADLMPVGGAISSQLSISTTAQSTSTSGLVPRARPPNLPPPRMMLALWGTSGLLMLVVLLGRGRMKLRGTGKRRRLIYAQVALATLALATAFWMGCETDIYTNVIQPSTVNGTPTGNYVITILGTYTGSTAGVGVTSGTTTTVTHQTTVNLTVQ